MGLRSPSDPGRRTDGATICLIHGAWHDGSCWEPVGRALRARGHRALAPDLPFHDPRTTWDQRTRPARAALDGVAGSVVVVGHSMGSAYAALVASALRDAFLVHLCPRLGGFAPPAGAPRTFRPGFPFPPERPDGTGAWDEDMAMQAMYGRVRPETARVLARRLRPMAPPADAFPLTGHPHVRTVLVYAADDELFEPAWQRFMARALLGLEPIEIPGGHFPMAEDPGGLADLLDRLTRNAEAAR